VTYYATTFFSYMSYADECFTAIREIHRLRCTLGTDKPNILYKYGTRFKDRQREREKSHIQRQWRMTETYVALMKLL